MPAATMPDVDLMNSAVLECTATLQRVATYRLPAALDQRLLWLSENKEAQRPKRTR